MQKEPAQGLKMRILILGGTRFIGAHTANRLADLGHDVTVFHRGKTEADLDSSIRHIYHPSANLGDRSRLDGFLPQFRELAPDIVLDMIPVTEEDAETVVTIFRGHAARVIAISSQDVYRAYGLLLGIEPDPLEPVPLSEDSPLRTKLFPYRASEPRDPDDPRRWMDNYEKILVERAFRSAEDLPCTILRLPMVYGPLDYQHRIREYLQRMDDNRPAILLEEGLAKWCWTPGYVENVADAIALAVTDQRSAGRIYNVGEPGAVSTLEWIRRIADAAGWDGEMVTAPNRLLPDHLKSGMNTDQDLIADSSRMREELSYEECLSQEEALVRTIEWERSQEREEPEARAREYLAEDAALATLGVRGI
jgi:nucleoside-diphosphate-sugar epimerase